MTSTAERLYIGGEWVPSRDGHTVDIIDPSDGGVVGHAILAGVQDTDAAVTAAQAALATWAQSS